MIIDKAFVGRLQAFSDKHCRGKIARLDLLQDMCAVFGFRIRVALVDETESNLMR